MAVFSNAHAYLEQYVKTATKGNVSVAFAVLLNRVQFRCKVCDMTLTAAKPDGENIDYSIQEFVKIHAHVGGHKDPECTCGGTAAWDKTHVGPHHKNDCPKWAPGPTAVTGDFKKVPIGSGLHTGNPDLKWEKAQQIKAALKKYEEEMANKNVAAKVKALKEGEGTPIPLQTQWINQSQSEPYNPEPYPAEKAANEDEKNKAELQKLLNIIHIKEIQANMQAARGAVSGIHVDPPPPKAKKLKIATGRRFR